MTLPNSTWPTSDKTRPGTTGGRAASPMGWLRGAWHGPFCIFPCTAAPSTMLPTQRRGADPWNIARTGQDIPAMVGGHIPRTLYSTSMPPGRSKIFAASSILGGTADRVYWPASKHGERAPLPDRTPLVAMTNGLMHSGTRAIFRRQASHCRLLLMVNTMGTRPDWRAGHAAPWPGRDRMIAPTIRAGQSTPRIARASWHSLKWRRTPRPVDSLSFPFSCRRPKRPARARSRRN
mmetsp:Transcript_13745/g.33259  ORF Transcript_13745/g.33259 Transcript_13745/m.33259 type:complete len:234 (+) Transcript_13745:270-971(+)